MKQQLEVLLQAARWQLSQSEEYYESSRLEDLVRHLESALDDLRLLEELRA